MACNNNNNDNDDYEIVLIDNENDARLCAQVLSKEFSLSNPLVVFNKYKSEHLFENWLWPLMTEVLDEKLSFLVRHRPTNEIVAAMVSTDFFLYQQKHPNEYPKSSSGRSARDMYADMRHRFIHQDLPHQLESNMVIYLVAGATNSHHAGKGIASRLRSHVCQYAKHVRGFQYAVVQTSNAATRHIYTTKLNGKETSILHPKNWLRKTDDNQDGTYPFQDYDDEPIVNILVELK